MATPEKITVSPLELSPEGMATYDRLQLIMASARHAADRRGQGLLSELFVDISTYISADRPSGWEEHTFHEHGTYLFVIQDADYSPPPLGLVYLHDAGHTSTSGRQPLWYMPGEFVDVHIGAWKSDRIARKLGIDPAGIGYEGILKVINGQYSLLSRYGVPAITDETRLHFDIPKSGTLPPLGRYLLKVFGSQGVPAGFIREFDACIHDAEKSWEAKQTCLAGLALQYGANPPRPYIKDRY